MELLYIWVKKYGCFNNAEFNFSPKHKFIFNHETLALRYNQNKYIIDNFFNNEKNENIKKGKILNINTIVGNNGAGKSTLLEIIFNNLVYGEGGVKIESIFIFNSEDINNRNKIKLYYNFQDKQPKQLTLERTDKCYLELFDLYENNKLNNELKIYEGSKNTKVNPVIEELEDTYFIYLSNTFENRYYNYNKMGNISDLSTIGLINIDSDIEYEPQFFTVINFKQDKNINYFYSEFNRQINFISNYKKHYKNFIPFKLPEKVFVYFINFENKKVELCKRIDDKEITKILDLLFDDYNISSNNVFKTNIARRLIIMFLNNNLNQSRTRNKNISPSIKNILLSIKFESDIWKYIIEFFQQIENENGNFLVKRYLEFINWIEQHIDNIGDFKSLYLENYFIVPTFKETIDNKNYIGIQEFFYRYYKTVNNTDYLNFSWGLSSGENTLISLFSRLFSITEELPEGYYLKGNSSKNQYYKKAIILIDEADLTLHPEWQQKFVKSILDFIQDIYQECEIQIIITTHSPIILSDIPKHSVLFLRNEVNKINVDDNLKHCETFGANISSLFYDSFFMERGSIGEFAKEKINYVIQKVKPINGKPPLLNFEEENKLRNIINIIGDEVLKDKLNEMLNKCINLNKSEIEQIDIIIQNLELRKRKLKGEIE